MDKIPLIDVSLLKNSNKDIRNNTIKDLYNAFSSIGFVSLTGTDIKPDIVNNMRSTVIQIFDVDDYTKNNEMITRNNYRGYIPLDFFTPNGTEYKADHYEGYKLHTEVSVDNPLCKQCSLLGPNIWPSKVPDAKENILKYWKKMDELSLILLTSLQESLELPKDALINLFKYPSLTNMTLLHYPIQKTNDDAYGFHPHKDTDALTIIASDPTNALQVQTLDGNWISPQISENSFIANIGDMLDFHAISMHQHDPDLYSPGHELKASRKFVYELSVYICLNGNCIASTSESFVLMFEQPVTMITRFR